MTHSPTGGPAAAFPHTLGGGGGGGSGNSAHPWGPVLHCRLSSLRAVVQRAESMSPTLSAVVVTHLPLAAVESSSSGYCGFDVATLASSPDVEVAQLLQRVLHASTTSPTLPPQWQTLGMDAPAMCSSLPLYLLSPRDGLDLESRLADVVAWSQHVTVGSSVDCRLPLTNRWHRGVVYSVLSAPFHRWLRVAFPDLPLSLWRWVERPQCRVPFSVDPMLGPTTGVVRRCGGPPVGDPVSKKLRWAAFDVMPPGAWGGGGVGWHQSCIRCRRHVVG